MDLGFEKKHNVILEALGVEENDHLKIIGEWFMKFSSSNQEEISLILPAYQEQIVVSAYNYLRLLSLLLKLLHKDQITKFENTCLFDVFQYKPSRLVRNLEDFLLEFKGENNHVLKWGENTVTDTNNFLPVFDKSQISTNRTLEALNNSFQLFKAIRKHQLINYPILIDLERDISLTIISRSHLGFDKLVGIHDISYDIKSTPQETASLANQLSEKSIPINIILKYPHKRNIHPWLTRLGDRRFELNFRKRFFYNDIEENQVLLLPNEFSDSISSTVVENVEYHIIDTTHNQSLYENLNDFKQNWKSLELNKFTVPFPKYWLTFINPSINKEEWIQQFKEDYPSISEKPIIRQIEGIISDIYDLNWIKESLSEYSFPKILFPESGTRRKTLGKVFNSFKNYVHSIDPEAKFISESETYEYNEYDSLILLDGFNVFNLVNLAQQRTKKFTVLVPDFIYYNYQPWIKYHLFQCESNALLNEARKNLDDNYTSNFEIRKEQRRELIEDVISDIKAYKKKYIPEIDLPTPEELAQDSEDIESSNDEEIENSLRKSEVRSKGDVIVTSTQGGEFKIPVNEPVLIQRDTIINARAEALSIGDMFLIHEDLKKTMLDEGLHDKLSEIPDRVRTYQDELRQVNNIYAKLNHRGISYKSKSYFESHYLLFSEEINEETIRIPRRKKDWSIICDFLTKNPNDRDMAFIAYYGRSKRNRVNEMYKEVINLFIEKSYFGSAEDSEVIENIKVIIDKYEDIFEKVEDYNPYEIGESISKTILNQLSFLEVKQLKIMYDE